MKIKKNNNNSKYLQYQSVFISFHTKIAWNNTSKILQNH